MSSPLAGLILLHSPWGLLLFSFGVLLLTGVVVLVFPETLEKTNAMSTHAVDAEPETANSSRVHTNEQPFVQKAAAVWVHVVKNKRLLALLLSLVFVVLGRFVQEMLLQYTTERYDWSWSQASHTLFSLTLYLLLTFHALLAGLLHTHNSEHQQPHRARFYYAAFQSRPVEHLSTDCDGQGPVDRQMVWACRHFGVLANRFRIQPSHLVYW